MDFNVRGMVAGAAKVAGATIVAVVVGTGTLGVAHAATEAVANNSVNSAKIVNNSVQGVDIKDGTLTSADVQDNTLTGADIGNNAIGTFEIADQNINVADLNPALRPLWAHIDGGNTTVTVLAGRGVTGVTHPLAGRYDVTFNRDISNCGWTATRTDNGAGVVAAGFVGVERALDVHTVIVRNWNAAGSEVDTEEDDGFTVRIDC